MTSPITLARQAALDALEHWAGLRNASTGKSLFAKIDRLEGEPSPDRETLLSNLGLGDLPYLTIIPETIAVQWKHTRVQHWLLDVSIVVVTPKWNLLEAERYPPEIVNALYASTPAGGSVSFVKDPATGTGYDPEAIPAITFALVGIGKDEKIKAIQTETRARLLFDLNAYQA